VIHAIVDRKREVRSDTIHVRNKTATARELLEVVKWYVSRGDRVIVNTRADVALIAGAAGVHLPSGSFAPREIRAIAPPGFVIGVSCHSREDLERAQVEGADYAYLAPVFAPLSKQDSRSPLGLDGFAAAIRGLTIPVFALGGLTPDRLSECLAAGAAGIAGISLVDLLEAPHPDWIAAP
jgi:thiamine-phosphate pyrophosphorylase